MTGRGPMRATAVLESCLYAENLDEAEAFYRDILGLTVLRREAGRHVFFRCGESMVLIFNPEHTSVAQTTVSGQKIPLHGASGAGHLALRSSNDELEAWKSHLVARSVEIESEVVWPGGGRSIYFRDPAGNSLELASPAIWGIE